MSNHCVLHERQHSKPETNNDEESTNRNIRAILKERHKNCEIRKYYLKQLQQPLLSGVGECETQRSNCQQTTN